MGRVPRTLPDMTTPVEFIKARLDEELARCGQFDEHSTFGTYWRIIDGGKAKPVWTDQNLKIYGLVAQHWDTTHPGDHGKIEWPPMVA